MELTKLEKAVNYWHALTPAGRLEIMAKVEKVKSITIQYRLCIKWIMKNVEL